MFYDINAHNNNAYPKGQSAESGLYPGLLSAWFCPADQHLADFKDSH